MVVGRSELAIDALRARPGKTRRRDPYGLMVHTTGSSIVEQALKLGRDPLDHVVAYYRKPESFHPAYVGGWDGRLVQVANELELAPHCAVAGQVADLESGAWERLAPTATVRAWKSAWPAFRSPAPGVLYPGPNANEAFIGFELLPIAGGAAQPAYPGSSFTLEQHQLVVLLACDAARRWAWPHTWAAGPRLLGHEDANPLTRSDNGGGWDPGALRARPRFAWRWVRELAAGRDPGPISP